MASRRFDLEPKIELNAIVSVSGAFVSWFANTLPVMQWCAAAAAVFSGVLAGLWVLIKIRDRLAGRKVED